METALFAVIFILLVIIIIMLFRQRKPEAPGIAELEAKLKFALASADSVQKIHERLEDLPKNVLSSITHSQGARSGKLNELLATLELAKYDRLIYLGTPIDFIGIDYERGIDFIEVKSGRERFSDDEIKLKDLVECKMVNYVPLSVQRINIGEEVEGENDDEG